MHLKKSVQVGDNELVHRDRQAGQAGRRLGHRALRRHHLLVTAVSAKEKKDVDFLPLTVEYQEKLYSAGRIPGSYFKREGRLTEKETLTCRLVDRALPPAVPRRLRLRDADHRQRHLLRPENEGDVHGITGASAALWCRTFPFNGPIAGIRVGRVDGQLVANPTAKQREQSDLDLVMACSKEAIVMVEGGAERGLRGGHGGRAGVRQGRGQPGARAAGGDARASSEVKTREYDRLRPPTRRCGRRSALWPCGGIAAGYGIHEKHDRYVALSTVKKDVIAKLKESDGRDLHACRPRSRPRPSSRTSSTTTCASSP